MLTFLCTGTQVSRILTQFLCRSPLRLQHLLITVVTDQLCAELSHTLRKRQIIFYLRLIDDFIDATIGMVRIAA
ncbi:hypothetical protein D3C71_2075950 [compost metagenome]